MLASAQIHENLCKHMQMHVCLPVSRAGDTSSGPTAERRAGKSRSPHFLRAFVLCQLFKHSRAASASGNPTGAARGAQGSGCSDLRALPFISELILLENSTCAHRGTSQKQLRTGETPTCRAESLIAQQPTNHFTETPKTVCKPLSGGRAGGEHSALAP